MPLFLVTIRDKALDEEQVVCWTILEAADDKEAHAKGWDKVNSLRDDFERIQKRYTRLVVGEVHPFELGTWTRPSKVCYRRHRGPDGEFPG
jgi:hypothetical protein